MQPMMWTCRGGTSPECVTSLVPQAPEVPRCGPSAAHVVVVDSREGNRDLYAEALGWLGFHVSVCATAAEAQVTIERELPDAVVVSVRLDGEDGFALCDSVKRVPRTARIPIIALTTGTADQTRALESKTFAAVAMLPCLPTALSELLVGVLASNGPPRPKHAAA